MTSKSARFEELFAEPQRNGLTKPKSVRGAGLPMVNMGELFAHPRIENLRMDLVPVTEKEMQYCLKAGDLLFARQSLVLEGAGQCSIFIGNNGPTVFESHLIRCRLDQRRANPHFYFYYFKSPEGRQAITSIVEQGAGASGIRGSDLVNLTVPVPPRSLQDASASILAAIDDRISLLRETNATLEAIAQALFKSWFVDFDPVRAKMEGRMPPAMNENTAALFPAALDSSAHGPLPVGWSRNSILHLATLLSGGTPKTDRPEYWGGDIPWASAKDVSQSAGGVLTATERTITQAGLNNSAARMVPALCTIVVARGATTGRMVLAGRAMAMNQTCYALVSKCDAPIALHFLLRHEMHRLVNASHGSVFDTITTRTFEGSTVLQPPGNLLRQFDETVSPLILQWIAGEERISTLTTLRDTLLPRLISGKLRLPQAAEQIDDAIRA